MGYIFLVGIIVLQKIAVFEKNKIKRA